MHDIEDLNDLGRKQRACPFFASKDLASRADLLFMPYTYLLDPVIRSSLGISLAGAVLVFDEAHNIEDQCREAASLDLELPRLEEVARAWSAANDFGLRPDKYRLVTESLQRLLGWVRSQGLPSQGGGTGDKMWSAGRLVDALASIGWGPVDLGSLLELVLKVREYESREGGAGGKKQRQEGGGEESEGLGVEDGAADFAPANVPKVGAAALRDTERIVQVLRLAYGRSIGTQDCEHLPDRREDYAMAVHYANRVDRDAHSNQQQRGGAGRGRGRGRRAAAAAAAAADDEDGAGPAPAARSERVLTWSLWCLNPAVALQEFKGRVRSLLLASGTLSPLSSFSSELGISFETALETPHVIDVHKQVLACALTRFPGGTAINATYRHVDLPDFQDSVGRALLEVARRVPDGVLLFLPSYALLDKLVARWRSPASGLLQDLRAIKPVFVEPRGSGDLFERTIQDYKGSIQQGRGGLLLAVCRGKVSEGIDFADAQARAVVVLGIPFPNTKDTKVALKKQYNSNGAARRGLLPGDVWYSQQAFRCLNQALGRCIRHKADWGAILLLDERYGDKRQGGLGGLRCL